MKMKQFLTLTLSTVALLGTSAASAVTIGFVEDFTSDVAGWEDTNNNPLTYVASGGVDDGSYASTTFSYLGYTSPFGGGPVTFRGSFSDNASGGAFVGDYLTEGVGSISVSFRHNAPEPLSLFMRVASAANFPGAVINQALSTSSGDWTTVVFEIDPSSPLCIGEGISCAVALSNVQNLQFGTNAPGGLVDDDFAYTLDIDRISVNAVPEPSTALLMALGLAGLQVTGRRKARA